MRRAKVTVSVAVDTSPLLPKASLGTRFINYIKKLVRQWPLLLLCIPALVLVIIFKYVPIYGILIAFKNYRPTKGV